LERIIIIGGGSLAQELITWMIDSKIFVDLEKRLFYIDDYLKDDIFLQNFKISYLGKIKDLKIEKNDKFYLGISEPKLKSKIVTLLEKKEINFCKFIHPSAIIANSAKIGKGTLIFPYSICSCNTSIGEFVTVNLHSAIGHDASIKSFSTISAFVDITGKVEIGEKVFIGSGARFIPSIKIGDFCKIGAGSTVYHSVPEGKTIYCNPAKTL
tara:strand:- start:83 stop:715 length:633 start_codon:yes stop_codon:yes gene_type:complete